MKTLAHLKFMQMNTRYDNFNHLLFDITVEFCMKRWTILRDRFAKEKKKMESVRSGSGATHYSYWEPFQSIEFLKDHIKRRM